MKKNAAPDVRLRVTGMMCQKNCGTTVEKALLCVPGVHTVDVQYNKSSAYVWGNASLSSLIDAVETVGYDAESMDSGSGGSAAGGRGGSAAPDVKLRVTGMMCQKNCGATVEKALQATAGVLEVDVSFERSTALVWGMVDANELIDAIEAVGYDAEVMGEADMPSSSASSLKASNGFPLKKKMVEKDIENVGTIELEEGESLHELELRVSGMTCAACSKSVKAAAMSVEGVKKAEVALLVEKVIITYVASPKDSQGHETNTVAGDCIAGITKKGYSAKFVIDRNFNDTQNHYAFKIGKGTVHLADPVAEAIATAVRALPGVARVNIMQERGVVEVAVDKIVTGKNSGNGVLVAGARDLDDAISGLGLPCTIMREESGGDDATEEELAQSYRMLVWALVLGVPVTLLHFLSEFSQPVMEFMDEGAVCDGMVTMGQLVMLCLNFPIQFGVGMKYYRGAYHGAMNGVLGMDTLVVTGTTITFAYSTAQLFFECSYHQWTPFIFFEASGMLIMFVTLGKYLEVYAKGSTSAALKTLLELQPSSALLATPPVEGGDSSNSSSSVAVFSPKQSKSSSSSSSKGAASPSSSGSRMGDWPLREIPIHFVQEGDILKILPGAQIPADGVVVEGQSFVDESIITGESTPVAKGPGGSLFGATTNQGGVLFMKTQADGSSSAIHQIVAMVEAAQTSRSPSQDFADRLAEIFTPVILLLASFVFIVWATLGYYELVPASWFEREYGSSWVFALLCATSVIVISCPCALGLATPTAVMVGTSLGASNGILIKSGRAFEAAHNLKAIIFDKTGTLTEGKPSVTDVVLAPKEDKPRGSIGSVAALSVDVVDDVQAEAEDARRNEVLRLAAIAERDSEHVLATAIVKAAEERGLNIINKFKSPTSTGSDCCEKESEPDIDAAKKARLGVTAKVEAGTVRVGSRDFMEDASIIVTAKIDALMWDLEVQGKTAVLVSLDKVIVGMIGIADRPKDEAHAAVLALQGLGVDVWMVTGDQRTTAYAIADDVGIPRTNVVAGALPMEKSTKVHELQEKYGPSGGSVAMIGDGINDSPALSAADIGIAIGAGTKLAIDSADMVLVRSNLLDAVVAVDLAKVVFRKIRQNFFWAIIYNAVAIPFAAGAFYPWTKMLIPPQYAGLSMAMSSISVVLSSLSLNLYSRPASTMPENVKLLLDGTPEYAALSTDGDDGFITSPVHGGGDVEMGGLKTAF